MAVRNFWIEADIDGRKTMLAGGPREKDGGLTVNLFQRSEGDIQKAVSIECFEENGELFTYVRINYEIVGVFSTKR